MSTKNAIYLTNNDGTGTEYATNKGVNTGGGGGGSDIQVTTLPPASIEEFGNVYQYVGATTSSLTKGFFYECVTTSGGYEWESCKVQDPIIVITPDGTTPPTDTNILWVYPEPEE